MSGSGLVQQATPCGLDGVRTERGRESRGTSATRPPPRRGPGGLPCTCVGDCPSCDCAHRPHWASGCPWGGRSTWSGGHLIWEQKGRLVIYRAEHRAGYGGAGISQDDGGMPQMGLRDFPALFATRWQTSSRSAETLPPRPRQQGRGLSRKELRWGLGRGVFGLELAEG